MSVFEMTYKNRYDEKVIVSILEQEVTVRHKSTFSTNQGVIIVDARIGHSVDETIQFVWSWFMVQRVFNKIIIAEMNDHVITFDKNNPMVKHEISR